MSRNAVINVSEALVTEQCIDCGVTFAIPVELQRQLIENHRNFYCPNGHDQAYTGPTEAERERKARERAEAEATRLRASLDQARASRDATERSLRATKAAATRARNRIEKGVCPHPECKRSFQNVKRHIERCHPDFEVAVETPAVL